MKKTLSVFLSFVMLFTCLCVGGISAQAAEKKTKITYLYEPETQTALIVYEYEYDAARMAAQGMQANGITPGLPYREAQRLYFTGKGDKKLPCPDGAGIGAHTVHKGVISPPDQPGSCCLFDFLQCK